MKDELPAPHCRRPLLERLRHDIWPASQVEDMAEAADHIESLEAKLEKAREALEVALESFELANSPSFADPYILVELQALCERAGYGNVMASASELWRTREGTIKGSEFVAGPCRVTSEKAAATVSEALKEISH